MDKMEEYGTEPWPGIPANKGEDEEEITWDIPTSLTHHSTQLLYIMLHEGIERFPAEDENNELAH